MILLDFLFVYGIRIYFQLLQFCSTCGNTCQATIMPTNQHCNTCMLGYHSCQRTNIATRVRLPLMTTNQHCNTCQATVDANEPTLQHVLGYRSCQRTNIATRVRLPFMPTNQHCNTCQATVHANEPTSSRFTTAVLNYLLSTLFRNRLKPSNVYPDHLIL